MVGNELSRLFVVIGAKTSQFNKGMDGVSNKMQNVSRKMKIAGGIMVGAIAAIGVASLKMAMDFSKAMREVNTMMLLNEDEFKNFSKEVQQLARDMGVNAVEMANALYQAISAGVPKENVIDFLTIATKAAIGGVTETTVAVDGLTTVINAFKIPIEDAEHVADVLFTTVKGGKTTMEELAASMFNVAPIAASAGVKFETVAAALATMTKQGIPTAQATTQLRQAIVAIMKPTKEMEVAIAILGYESGQAMIEELGLAETLDLLRDSTQGSDQMLMKMFGSVEAGQAVLALTGQNAQTFADDLEAIGNAAGASQSAFEEMEKEASRKLQKLKANLADVAITIGNALMPALIKILETLTPLIRKFGDWVAANATLTIKIMAVVAAVGALLFVLPTLIKLVHALNIALTFLARNPIVLVVIAVAASIAGFIAEMKDGIAMIQEMDDALKGHGKSLERTTTLWEYFINALKVGVPILYGIMWAIKTFKVPELPPMPGGNITGPELQGNITVPKLGTGALITEPTLAMLGEKGPEMVMPLSETGSSLGDTIINQRFEGPWFIREEADIKRIARELYNLQRINARAAGVA